MELKELLKIELALNHAGQFVNTENEIKDLIGDSLKILASYITQFSEEEIQNATE